MRFEGRTAIVTGGAGGIGSVLARRFAAEGALAVVADLAGDAAERLAAAIRADGGRALAVACDVADTADVERLVAVAGRESGRIDVLVNNALHVAGDDAARIDDATWDADLRGTLASAFRCTRAVLPGMVRAGGGAIVNVASVNALACFGNEAYSAAKAGMISLTENVAVRYGCHGIRANAVAPGTIRTPVWDARLALDPTVLDTLVKWYPLGRVGEPDDVASAVLFLASDEAAFITGVTLRVDGGLLAGNPVMAHELLVESREA
jgi:meso-butanediol dehydrogenase / (S,S)-butanediol dehydrogenase / diacetyl reductase